MNYLLNNVLFNAAREVKDVLDPDQKRRALIMIGLLIINAIFDFAGLATIALLIVSALENNVFEDAGYTASQDASDAAAMFNTVLKWLYDISGVSSHMAFLFYLSIIIFVAFLVKNAISLYIGYVQSRFAFNVSLRLNKKMFKYYYDQGYLFIKDSTAGKKVYAVVDIPMRFASHYLNTLLQLGTEVVVLLIIAIALLVIDPIAVALLAITILPTFVFIYNFTKNKARDIGLRRNQLAPINYAKVFEAMNGFVDVKLSNLENEVLKGYGDIQKRINHVDVLYFGIYQKLNQRTNDIIFGLGIMVIFGYAHFFSIGKEEVLSLLGLFAVAAYKFLPSFNRVMASLLTIKNSTFVIDELKKLRHTELIRFSEAGTLNFEKTLSLHDLSYKYPKGTDKVLEDVSLTINKGETIGFIGTSGSGKTTLLKLLLRLLKEESGYIAVDGVVIDDLLESSYQKIIGYVEQEIFILNDTILSNIAFGRDQADVKKAWLSLAEAQLDDFVKSHPDGLNMPLGENGVNLSGGQKQRIGIARALYKDSEILIFDEATSALDGDTERAVVESINHLSNLGKTVIIVAHRITTLEKCSRIFEIENGKLAREPSYDALLRENILTDVKP